MEKRLGAAAKELNTAVHTIAEYLSSKGFKDVTSNPATKITAEMFALAEKEFGGSAQVKKQAEKIETIYDKNKKEDESAKRRQEDDRPDAMPNLDAFKPGFVEEAPKKVTPPTAPKAPVEEVVIPKVEEKPVAKAPAHPTIQPVISDPSGDEDSKKTGGLKVLGYFDLDAAKKAAAPKNKGKKEAPKKEAPKPQPPKVEAPKKEEPKPVAQPKPVEPPKPVVQEAPKVEAPKVEVTPVVPEEEAMYKIQAPELRGLKVLGKVQIDARDSEPGNKKRKKKEALRPGARPGVNGANGKPQGPGGPQGDRPPRDPNAPNNNNNNNRRGDLVTSTDRGKRKRLGEGAQPAENNANRPAGANTGGNNQNRPAGNNTGGPGGNNQNRPNNGPRPAGAPGTGNNNTSGNNAGRGRRDATPARSEKEIDDKVRLTMNRIQGTSKKKAFGKDRKSRDEQKEQERQRRESQGEEKQFIEVTEFVTVSDLASLMDVTVGEVITKCMSLGVFVSINQRIDAEVIELVADEFDFDVKFISAEQQLDKEEEEEVEDPALLSPRSPIVTVMGHVDHGKTSLLDFIRKANVAAGEAGGITQHIGAYEVHTEHGNITFLDTPGHEAFTAMRARGAKVTDIAIIVVSADDSVMPQTREAISHAQAAGVPMVFAINKIDKDGANPEKIKEQLAAMNILVEDWGGTFQSQDISAKKGLNMDKLLEKVLLQAEVLELKGNPNRLAIGTVLEASLDKGRGYVTKMLVQTGTLRIGDPMVAGQYSGKVKAMFNERGQKVKEAGPSTPVLVLGLSGAPQAGEKVKVMENEQDAKQLAGKRAQLAREQEIRTTKRISLVDIRRRMALGSFKQLNIIIKADFDGSMEALSGSLLKLSTESVALNIVYKAVGPVTESDVLLASASDAIIVAFQVRTASQNARRLAETEGVEIKTYSIIYQAIDEIKSAMEGLLDPTKEEKVVCNIDIREVFDITKVGTVAGCFVTDGVVTRNTFIRIIRDGIVVFPVKEGQVGELASLKRFKDDVREVKTGFECGLGIKNFNDIRPGDVIEGYEIIEVKQKL